MSARRRQPSVHWHVGRGMSGHAALAAALALLASDASLAAAPVAAAEACVNKRGQPMVPLDVNTATVAQLTQLPRLGDKKAEAILALRAKRPFVRTTELTRVKGVGKKTLLKWKPCLTVGAATGAKSSSAVVQTPPAASEDAATSGFSTGRHDVGGPVSGGTGH